MTLCSPYWFQVSSLGHSKVFSACTQNGDVDFLFTSHWLITNRNSFFIHYVLAFNFCSDHFTGDLVYPPSRKWLLHIFTVLYILCMWFEASFMDQVVQCSASSLGRTTVHSITTQPSTTMTEMTWAQENRELSLWLCQMYFLKNWSIVDWQRCVSLRSTAKCCTPQWRRGTFMLNCISNN